MKHCYSIRHHPSGRKTLIEEDVAGLGKVWGREGINRCTEEEAHWWVKNGWEHETGLFVDDDGIVRYADPES